MGMTYLTFHMKAVSMSFNRKNTNPITNSENVRNNLGISLNDGPPTIYTPRLS